MKYYQVKEEFEGSEIMQADKHGRLIDVVQVLVANELYTTKEFNKLIKGNKKLLTENRKLYIKPEIAFNIVEHSAKGNLWFFGCRFPNNQAMVEIIEPAIEEAKREFYNKAL